PCEHRDLHSFPTRRSSDLGEKHGSDETHIRFPLISWRNGRSVHPDGGGRRCPGGSCAPMLLAADLRALYVRSFLDGRARGWEKIDRKSTRLNSSHVKISYA